MPVHAKPTLAQIPIVARVAGIGEHCPLTRKNFSIHSGMSIGTDLSAVTNVHETSGLIARAHFDEQSFRVTCVFGLDADYSVNSVCSPQGRTRTTNHFNAIHIFE